MLGGPLLRPSNIEAATQQGLTADTFRWEAHRVTWLAMSSCFAEHGHVDLVLLTAELGPAGLAGVGGYSFLAGLPASCPDSLPAVWLTYVTAVLDAHRRRVLSVTCAEVQQWADDGEDLDVLVDILRGALEPFAGRSRALWLRADHVELGGQLADELGQVVYDRGELRRWTPGGWAPVPEAEARNLASTYAGSKVRAGRDDRTGRLRFKQLRLRQPDLESVYHRACDVVAEPGYFDAAPPGVAYTNGVVVVDGPRVQLETLDADRHRVLVEHVMPWAYDPDARCDRWLRFLGEVWPHDDSDARIALLGEFLGACLAGVAHHFSRALVLHGEGSNGKSTLIGVVRQLLTDITGVPWHQLSARSDPNRYWVAALATSRLNLVEELPAGALRDTSTLKALLDGGAVQARSPSEKPFMFVPKAGHIVACNSLPAVSDASHGFWRRIILLDFPRRFTDADKDPTLGAALSDELVGVSTWALAHLPALLARGHYAIPPSLRDGVRAWRSSSTPAMMWAQEHLVADEDGRLRMRKDLYLPFAAWAREGGYGVPSERTFSQQLQLAGYRCTRIKGTTTFRVRYRTEFDFGSAA